MDIVVVDNCPFCFPNENLNIIAENNSAFAIYDSYAISKGHSLIIPKRHYPNYFDASVEEQIAMFELVNQVKIILDELFNPDGYNIGVNINEAAGQTISHVHIHLIPRYEGDVENPRGGIRNVIPGKGDY